MAADIDAGTFEVTYDDATKCYEVREKLEDLESGPCANIEEVLEFIRRNTWKPDDSD